MGFFLLLLSVTKSRTWALRMALRRKDYPQWWINSVCERNSETRSKMKQICNGWLLACLSVQKRRRRRRWWQEAERCQIVCTDESTIELDPDQLWNSAAALQEEHPGLGMVILQVYILWECTHMGFTLKCPRQMSSLPFVLKPLIYSFSSDAQRTIYSYSACIK